MLWNQGKSGWVKTEVIMDVCFSITVASSKARSIALVGAPLQVLQENRFVLVGSGEDSKDCEVEVRGTETDFSSNRRS